MIYGSLKKERLCFNDGTLWSGYPKDYNSKVSLENLERVRNLIFEGKNAEADALCEEKLTGFYSEAFMPLGEISLKFSGIDKACYSRSLDLSNAVHTVKQRAVPQRLFRHIPIKYPFTELKQISLFRLKSRRKANLNMK